MLPTKDTQRLLEALFHPPATGGVIELFAVLDGAAVRKLPDFFQDNEMEHLPLVRGQTDPLMITRIPYIVRLQRRDLATEQLLAEGWGRHWGIFAAFSAGTSLDQAATHFRKLLQVRLPDGRIVFFRFYDPRVLRPFLPTCDAPQLDTILGGVVALRCESDEGSSVLDFTVRSSVLRTGSFPLHGFADSASLQPVARRLPSS